MKPAPFRYFAPQSLAEALHLLAEYGPEVKVLAGGQSLVPAMNFRLAQPTILVDLNRVAELDFLRTDDDGALHIGAMTRQRRLEQDPTVARTAPLLHETMPHIAHVQIRNRGTIGGSLAHADPAAELPAVALALDAQLRLQSQRGERSVAASDFYLGLFTTALEPDELLVEIVVPTRPAQTGWSIQEIARRHGDYALVGVATTLTLDDTGRCNAAKVVLLSVGDGPVVAQQGAHLLAGERPSAQVIAAVAEVVGECDIDPPDDIHASAAFRRHLARVLTRRALTSAVARAQG